MKIAESNKASFDIFVASETSATKNTFRVFQAACTKVLGKRNFDIRVIDIIKSPDLADTEKILAIPTIVRRNPRPAKRVIGQIADDDTAENTLRYLLNDLES